MLTVAWNKPNKKLYDEVSYDKTNLRDGKSIPIL